MGQNPTESEVRKCGYHSDPGMCISIWHVMFVLSETAQKVELCNLSASTLSTRVCVCYARRGKLLVDWSGSFSLPRKPVAPLNVLQ